MDYLYHGSAISDIKELAPSSKSNVVYLTPNRAYSLFYIWNGKYKWVTCGVRKDGVVEYEEQFPNQLYGFYNGVSGYIYICEKDNLIIETSSRDIWVSQRPVRVYDKENISDVYDEILKYEKIGAVHITKYEMQTNERKQEIHDMMVNYIYKNNLLTLCSEKSTFIKGIFPQSWGYAEAHAEVAQDIMDEWKNNH